VRVIVQPKNVATTTGPSTAWFRNTFHMNGGRFAASDAPAAVGNRDASAAYQKCCAGP
jgi:hypothetical protein